MLSNNIFKSELIMFYLLKRLAYNYTINEKPTTSNEIINIIEKFQLIIKYCDFKKVNLTDEKIRDIFIVILFIII